MRLTRHATERWIERFPHLDPEQEWAAARRAGQRVRRKIRRACPAHARLTSRMFRGTFYLVTDRSRIAWVCGPDEAVITVFPIP